MSNKRPLCNYSGLIKELHTADTLRGVVSYHGVESIGDITFDNNTHVLSITSINYWFQGIQYVNDSTMNCDIDSFKTLTANTLYFFYFNDANGTFVCNDSAWGIKTAVQIATVYWNGSEGAVGYEVHNHTRDLDWHANAHRTIGCRYESGLALTYPSAAVPGTLTIGPGVIADEDIYIDILQQSNCRIFYQVSTGKYTWINSSLPYAGTSGQVQYLDIEIYSLINVISSNYAVMWVYASNDLERNIYIFPSHISDPHINIAAARAELAPNLIGLGLTSELKLIYKFIYKGNGDFQESTDYRRTSSIVGGGVSSISAASVTFTPTGNISSTTVQTALQELDTEKISDVGSAIYNATEKITPVDGDTFGISDSADSNIFKKLSWSNIKTTLKNYFDTIYTSISHIGTGGTSHSTATVDTAGFMSTSDKLKLDNLENLELTADSVTFSPSGGVTSNTVQDAIEELELEILDAKYPYWYIESNQIVNVPNGQEYAINNGVFVNNGIITLDSNSILVIKN